MTSLATQGTRLTDTSNQGQRNRLSAPAMTHLRQGLATCRGRRGLTPEARDAIMGLCDEARREGWTPEQLVVAVKDACYTSAEITQLTTTSERDTFLAKVVSACIQEFFQPNSLDDTAGQ